VDSQQDAGQDFFDVGSGRLRGIVAYGRKVFDLAQHLGRIRDGRKSSKKATAPLIATTVFFCGLLRIRSFNALEPKLAEKPFLSLVDAPPDIEKLCSADTLGRVLRTMGMDGLRSLCDHIVTRAERNKVFREGWIGALRYVAVDGWEPIPSYNRHCSNCLVRRVGRKQPGGTVEEVDQYYHRYVVAMLIDDRFDMALDFEPLLPNDLRPPGAAKDDEDEGELTAAKRLVRRVKQTYGWLDVVVADSLYANGPFLTLVKELRMGSVIIAKKENDEPLKEALRIWDRQPPQRIFEDAENKERIELWDCHELETLSSYKGAIRIVRGRVTDLKNPAATPKTWCIFVTGKAMKLSAHQVLRVARGRWHIENTGYVELHITRVMCSATLCSVPGWHGI